MIATYLASIEKSQTQVYHECFDSVKCLPILWKSNLPEMGSVDGVILGYVDHLVDFVGPQ